MKKVVGKLVELIKLIESSIVNIVLSLFYYKSIKIYLSNHFTVGIRYLKRQNTRFPHPVGIVIGRDVKIGKDCIIYQNVTIGTKETKNFMNAAYPTIENNVTVFANSVIFGDITIGQNTVIGAGSVVFIDIPPNSVVVGNPAKIVNKKYASAISD